MSAIPSKILLIEDSPTDGQFIIRSLKKGGLEDKIIWMRDGAEAIEFIFATDHHNQLKNILDVKIILLDLKLPKVDGLEVLHQIKSDRRARHIPVILFTSSNQDEDIKTAYRLGVNSYVVKQVGFDEFSHSVAKIAHYWMTLNLTPKVKA